MSVNEFIEFIAEKVQHVGVREDLIEQHRLGNVAFAWEMLARYLGSSEDDRAGIEAFHSPMVDSDVRASQHVLALKAEEPTTVSPMSLSGLISHLAGLKDYLGYTIVDQNGDAIINVRVDEEYKHVVLRTEEQGG